MISRLVGLAVLICIVALVVSGHGLLLWDRVQPLLVRLGDWLSAVITARTA